MKKILTAILMLVVTLNAAVAQQLVAGAAKVDITPSESDLLHSTDIISGKLFKERSFTFLKRKHGSFFCKNISFFWF